MGWGPHCLWKMCWIIYENRSDTLRHTYDGNVLVCLDCGWWLVVGSGRLLRGWKSLTMVLWNYHRTVLIVICIHICGQNFAKNWYSYVSIKVLTAVSLQFLWHVALCNMVDEWLMSDVSEEPADWNIRCKDRLGSPCIWLSQSSLNPSTESRGSSPLHSTMCHSHHETHISVHQPAT